MKLEEQIKELFRTIHESNTNYETLAGSLPNFTTVDSGLQVSFSSSARKQLKDCSEALYKHHVFEDVKFDEKEYFSLTRQASAEVYSDILLNSKDIETIPSQEFKEKIKSKMVELVKNVRTDFTFYLPVNTLGIEIEGPYTLGPVTIVSRDTWIDMVTPHRSVVQNAAEGNGEWRENLKLALSDKNAHVEFGFWTSMIYGAVQDTKAFIKISVSGRQQKLSSKLARLTAKAALDSLSLLTGNPGAFRRQTLFEERRSPSQSHDLVEVGGFLGFPGFGISPDIGLPQMRRSMFTQNNQEVLDSISVILDGFAAPENAKYPQLCSRWATALDWYGEACRESNDAIAIAKFGTSLDVLSCCGGKADGIARMVSNLTGLGLEENVMLSGPEVSLMKMIKNIYEEGRSQILHGNKFDRLKSFEELKLLACSFARSTLIASALALQQYTDEDVHNGFSKMTLQQS